MKIGGISFDLFPQVAGGFAFLLYAATLCGTQRTENRRFKITFRLLPLNAKFVYSTYAKLHGVYAVCSSDTIFRLVGNQMGTKG